MFNIKFADDWIWTATSSVGGNCSTNWATTTAQGLILYTKLQVDNVNVIYGRKSFLTFSTKLTFKNIWSLLSFVMQLVDSVTRFGEILSFLQNLQSLGQFFEGLFTICENFGPTGKFLCLWASFHWCKWPNVEK